MNTFEKDPSSNLRCCEGKFYWGEIPEGKDSFGIKYDRRKIGFIPLHDGAVASLGVFPYRRKKGLFVCVAPDPNFGSLFECVDTDSPFAFSELFINSSGAGLGFAACQKNEKWGVVKIQGQNFKWVLSFDFDSFEAAESALRTIDSDYVSSRGWIGRDKFAVDGFDREVVLPLKSMNPIQTQIEDLLRSTKREGIEDLIAYLCDNNFYENPSSKNRHHNYRGGLAAHSLGVYRNAMRIIAKEQLSLPLDQVIIASILHDVHKCFKFEFKDGKFYEKKSSKIPCRGHGNKGVYLLENLVKFKLTDEERMAIRWHMGSSEFEWVKDARNFDKLEPEYHKAMHCKLSQVIHRADGINTHHHKPRPVDKTLFGK